MKNFFVFLILFCYSCKTLHANKPRQMPGAASTPMSCKIQGEIVSIIEKPDTDTGSICSKYPCKAMVKMIDVAGCGSSISAPLHIGDTVELKFAYTLASTAVAIPDMAARFPGLKKGNVFSANAEQRLRPGMGAEYIIYDYQIVK